MALSRHLLSIALSGSRCRKPPCNFLNAFYDERNAFSYRFELYSAADETYTSTILFLAVSKQRMRVSEVKYYINKHSRSQ
jgi:hypothetical protein